MTEHAPIASALVEQCAVAFLEANVDRKCLTAGDYQRAVASCSCARCLRG